MLKAANKAGIGSSQDLVLISGPEAAAIYCLATLPNCLNVSEWYSLSLYDNNNNS